MEYVIDKASSNLKRSLLTTIQDKINSGVTSGIIVPENNREKKANPKEIRRRLKTLKQHSERFKRNPESMGFPATAVWKVDFKKGTAKIVIAGSTK
ncbi:MAG: hypothetical protein ABEH43_10380 [Flavobacteriales bacterium]